MLGNFIKKINKPITHVIFIVVIYAVLYFLKEKIYKFYCRQIHRCVYNNF